MDRLLFGSAYYDEYMPYDRIDTDVEMMKAAGFTTVRIAESTWATLEPQPGVFDFTHVDRAVAALVGAGIDVVVGTPTYAVPSWLVRQYPSVLAETPRGKNKYGVRQNMNIVDPAYRLHAERVIRKLMEHTAHLPGVVGFQVDNETKYFDTAGPDVQQSFVRHLRALFGDDVEAMNQAYGLDYWSNRVNTWEDMPDVTGTVNGSLAAEFDRFRRGLVEEYLAWQTAIVREYARDDQWVTQNFDYDWGPGWSYGVQPAVDHFRAARAVDLAGVDIYHPTGDDLTGVEIAFGGDMNRSVKDGANYLVVETQAQGQMGWLPFPGQLRQQALSHVASGACGVMYWHWHSIHNSVETYWKGLLSHDLGPNPTYREACRIGEEFARHGARIGNLRKTNRVALLVSNEALTALELFAVETGFPRAYGTSMSYNDVMRWVYDRLFELNVEVDFVGPCTEGLDRYAMVVVPALYSAPESTLRRLRDFVAGGGHLVTTFRTAVTDEHVKVWTDAQPHLLTDVLGLSLNQFTRPTGVQLAPAGDLAAATAHLTPGQLAATKFIELLVPDGAEVLAAYDHHAWGGTAAVTRHRFGAGSAVHVGTLTSPDLLREVLRLVAADAGVLDWATGLAGAVTVRRGVNAAGEQVVYLFNYSKDPVDVALPVAGHDVFGGRGLAAGTTVTIGAWDVLVLVH